MSEQAHIAPFFSADNDPCLSPAQMKAYAGGKLKAAEKHPVERHLLNCELCALAFEGIAEMDPSEIEAAAADLTDRAWQRVGELDARRRRSAIWWVSSAAAILLLIVTGFVLLDGPESNNPDLSAIADRMMEEDTPADVQLSPDATLADAGPAQKSETTSENELAGSGTPRRDRGEEPVSPKMTGSFGGPPPPPVADELAPLEEILVDVEEEELAELDDLSAVVEEDGMEFDDKDEYFNGLANAPVESEELKQTETMDAKSLADAPVVTGNSQEQTTAPTTSGNVNLYNYSTPADVMADSTQAPEKQFKQDLLEKDADQWAGGDFGSTEGIEENEVVSLDRRDSELGEVAVESTISSRGARNQSGKKVQRAKDRRTNQRFLSAKEADEISVATPAPDNRTAPEERSIDYFQRGMDAYRNQDYATGARYLRQASQDTPANLTAHLYAARSYLEMEQYDASLYHLDRILAEPESSLGDEARWYKSVVLLRKNDKEGARKLLEEVQRNGGPRSKRAQEILDAAF